MINHRTVVSAQLLAGVMHSHNASSYHRFLAGLYVDLHQYN
jgi:hypothetical protein